MSSKMLEEVSVPGIGYEICRSCGDITLSYEEGLRANRLLQKKENAALESLPFKSFITHNEAADILEITKQAFSKNSRIKRGFIYSVKKGGRQFFLRRSVLLFKQNSKDGRVKLTPKKAKIIETITPTFIPLTDTLGYDGPKYVETVNAESKNIKYLYRSGK